MEKQNKWQYCPASTQQHPLSKKHPDCIEKIHELCRKEGARKTPFESEVCLNIDQVEHNLAKREKRSKRSTMDLAFGLAHKSTKRFVPVELKLNIKSIYNLEGSELKSKIAGSIALLGHNPQLLNKYYFVFKPGLKNQAERNLRRLFENRRIVSGIDLNDLKNHFF